MTYSVVVRRAGLEPAPWLLLKESPLPIGLPARTDAGSRTPTGRPLMPLPLPDWATSVWYWRWDSNPHCHASEACPSAGIGVRQYGRYSVVRLSEEGVGIEPTHGLGTARPFSRRGPCRSANPPLAERGGFEPPSASSGTRLAGRCHKPGSAISPWRLFSSARGADGRS